MSNRPSRSRLRPVELDVLLTLAAGQRHGYAIIQETEAREGGPGGSSGDWAVPMSAPPGPIRSLWRFVLGLYPGWTGETLLRVRVRDRRARLPPAALADRY